MLPNWSHVSRYHSILVLLWRYGDTARVGSSAEFPTTLLQEEWIEEHDFDKDPETFAKDLEEMGATFIKLGQMLSTRADLLPPAHRDALARLQDNVQEIDFETVKNRVEEEVGRPIDEVFAEFKRAPLAAASIAQVHAATLRDGQAVVVKVQRPGLREQVFTDLDILQRLADWMETWTDAGRRIAAGTLLATFRTAMLRELDFTSEAKHLRQLAAQLSDSDRLRVPLPIPGLNTSRVLVMERLEGVPIHQVEHPPPNGGVLARELLAHYLSAILDEGFFHADPHPGNLLLNTKLHQIGIIDLGMVGLLSERARGQMLFLLLAIDSGDEAEIVRQFIRLQDGADDSRGDRRGLERDLAPLTRRYKHPGQEGGGNLGTLLFELVQCGTARGFRPPPELTLIGKTLLHLDESARRLAPDFDPATQIQNLLPQYVARLVVDGLRFDQILFKGLEGGRLASELPGHAYQIISDLAEGNLHMRMQIIDEAAWLDSLKKIANRIAAGTIIAGLLVGAAVLSRVPNTYTVFGYPLLSVPLFITAAGAGIALLFDILVRDHRNG